MQESTTLEYINAYVKYRMGSYKRWVKNHL